MECYFDNNSTTALHPSVIDAVCEELTLAPANPSSVHRQGRAARARLASYREKIANSLRCHSQELYFTSGATESLNLLIHRCLTLCKTGPIVSSQGEHPAIRNVLRQYEKSHEIIYLPLGPSGAISPQNIPAHASAIILSGAYSETGVKNPIEEISLLASHYNIPFIVDGVALLGKSSLSFHPGITAMVFSGHKIHAPQGSGLIWAKPCSLTQKPLLFGGGQEKGLRSGTENLPAIAGLAAAIHIIGRNDFQKTLQYMQQLRNDFEAGVLSFAPNSWINGASSARVVNTSNITLPGIDGEVLLAQMDLAGISLSMGSACSSGGLEPSPTLLSMNVSPTNARSSIRFSCSYLNTPEEIHYTLQNMRSILAPHASFNRY